MYQAVVNALVLWVGECQVSLEKQVDATLLPVCVLSCMLADKQKDAHPSLAWAADGLALRESLGRMLVHKPVNLTGTFCNLTIGLVQSPDELQVQLVVFWFSAAGPHLKFSSLCLESKCGFTILLHKLCPLL